MIDVVGTTVTVMVADLDRAQAFYCDRLGFSVSYRAGPHYCQLERDGFLLGMHPMSASSEGAGESKRVSIGFRVSDIAEATATLTAEGVRFPSGVVDDGPIKRADFSDPDGTPLYLVQTT